MSYFIPGLIIGFLLGAASFGVLATLAITRRRPAPPPTKFRRKYRDAVVEEPPPWEREEVGGIRYEHLGMTGEEV